MRLIDSHAHLQSREFDDDRLEVLAAARLAGLERMLVPGWDVASSEASMAFVRGRPWLLGSAGAHPHVADQIDDAAWARLEELAAVPLVAAIGETGLDYDRGFSSREGQLVNLRRHIGLAKETDKPLILHCRSKAGLRDAQDDLLQELDAGGRPRRCCTPSPARSTMRSERWSWAARSASAASCSGEGRKPARRLLDSCRQICCSWRRTRPTSRPRARPDAATNHRGSRSPRAGWRSSAWLTRTRSVRNWSPTSTGSSGWLRT